MAIIFVIYTVWCFTCIILSKPSQEGTYIIIICILWIQRQRRVITCPRSHTAQGDTQVGAAAQNQCRIVLLQSLDLRSHRRKRILELSAGLGSRGKEWANTQITFCFPNPTAQLWSLQAVQPWACFSELYNSPCLSFFICKMIWQ